LVHGAWADLEHCLTFAYRSQHFIGNAAINLANGEPELQVEYSSGFTAISFFVPIIVLLAAFVAVGTNNAVSGRRVTAGGILCGGAICGMHYLGNASITNYVCVYQPAYVVGAAMISIVASIVALAIFFIFRAMWATSWRKRAISAVVLAGAVSGMHWCAAVGTRYRLVTIKSKDNKLSRGATVIVVICLVSLLRINAKVDSCRSLILTVSRCLCYHGRIGDSPG
jgi:NO-binding membrane sensor protein with MHYT domain